MQNQDDSVQVDPDKFFRQIEQQRNNALNQAAQCVALIEQQDEMIESLRAQLAEATKQVEDLVKVQSNSSEPTTVSGEVARESGTAADL